MQKEEIQELIDNRWIQFRTIIEILGAPKEHIQKTLHEYAKKIKEDPDIKVISEEFSEPDPKENLFAMFVELDCLVKDTDNLLGFCFDYMPSSVEIIKPMEIKLKSPTFSGLLNDLQSRLHQVDMELKNTKASLELSEVNMGKILQNFVHALLAEKPRPLQEFVQKTGVQSDLINKVTNYMTEKGFIKFDKSSGLFSAVTPENKSKTPESSAAEKKHDSHEPDNEKNGQEPAQINQEKTEIEENKENANTDNYSVEKDQNQINSNTDEVPIEDQEQ